VAVGSGDQDRVLPYVAMTAPGTPLRDGLERILRGRTGALVVLGHSRVVQQLCTGGFEIDVPFTPTALRELAKMDGAIVLDQSAQRIVRAGVHLMPDPAIDTVETGTRHRTADRVAQQTGAAVVSVSASMATISLYVERTRHVIEATGQLLTRANQALQTLERYRDRLWEGTDRLSSLEVQDQVTVRDVALLAQRLEMVRRLEDEVSQHVLELGTDGRLLGLQLNELGVGIPDLRDLLAKDYRPADPDVEFGLDRLGTLSATDLLDPLVVARTIGFPSGDHLDSRVTTRGYRQVAQIPRLPTALGIRLIEHFGSLQGLFGASAGELQEVDGVGEQRARTIRDGLVRLAESAYTEPVR
jgi:diadenylate cyclase